AGGQDEHDDLQEPGDAQAGDAAEDLGGEDGVAGKRGGDEGIQGAAFAFAADAARGAHADLGDVQAGRDRADDAVPDVDDIGEVGLVGVDGAELPQFVRHEDAAGHAQEDQRQAAADGNPVGADAFDVAFLPEHGQLAYRRPIVPLFEL